MLPGVVRWVRRNSGTRADARDLFQEALVVVFQRLREGDLTLTCPLENYLLAICRNQWRTRLKRKQRAAELPAADTLVLDPQVLTRLESSDRDALYRRHFAKLEAGCQRILRWYFERVPVKEIAQRLNTSANYIKKRKHVCQSRLKGAIQADPVFLELQ